MKRLSDLASYVHGGPFQTSVKHLEALIERHHLAYSPNPVRAALREAIPDEAVLKQALAQTRYEHNLIRPFDDAEPLLTVLRGNFRLGVIANQPPGVPARLSELGWRRYFEVVLGSGDVGVQKPSPEIFIRALKAAGTTAQRSVYIGDRIDNDVVPAKALGFSTIRFLAGFAKVQTPRNETETADATVDSLRDIVGCLT